MRAMYEKADVGASSSVTVAYLDVLAREICSTEHRYARLNDHEYHIEQPAIGASE